ncbi:MAG: hypothetical protein OJF47_003302 [Nitrospira sp.]|nr:MAG: hypothetical protein OJF47_000314 [Nitrospira sp.]WHZ24190.1 MAG: hypothetical protein OJF47_003302 [Nitrospira sp.]
MLLPPSLGEWLPEDHRAYFASDVGTELDLTRIVKTYGGVTRRNAPYDPRRLVTILLYAYAGGIPASRQIARELDENVAFRVLAANQRPDFRTLSDFRKPHLAALTELFVQVLRRCQRAGWVTLGHIALDGTQLKANASKPKAMSDGRMGTDEARLKREVDALLQQAEAAEAQDDAAYGADRRGDELPAELARREQRRKTIRAAKAVLEQEAQADATLTPAAQNTGARARPRRGRPPPLPSPGPPPEGAAQFHRSRASHYAGAKGRVVQGYNCQAAVDATAPIIVAADVTDEPNDKQHAQPLLPQVLAHTGQVPRIVTLAAGYFSEANVTALTALGCTPLAPPDRQLHSQAIPAAPRGRPPAGLSVAPHPPDTTRAPPLRPAQSDRRTGLWPDQARPRLSPVLVARDAAGARRGGAHLSHA